MIRSVKSIIFFQMLLKYVTKINLTDKNQFTQFCLHGHWPNCGPSPTVVSVGRYGLGDWN